MICYNIKQANKISYTPSSNILLIQPTIMQTNLLAKKTDRFFKSH